VGTFAGKDGGEVFTGGGGRGYILARLGGSVERDEGVGVIPLCVPVAPILCLVASMVEEAA
jgi:hypothetical protein